jgi:hypothetical protein
MRAGGMRSHRRAVVHRKGALQVSFARYPMSAVRQMQGAQAGRGRGRERTRAAQRRRCLPEKTWQAKRGLYPCPAC